MNYSGKRRLKKLLRLSTAMTHYYFSHAERRRSLDKPSEDE